jgi:hypothetical protein
MVYLQATRQTSRVRMIHYKRRSFAAAATQQPHSTILVAM